MTYILSQVSKIPYVNRMFIVNLETVGLSICLIYLFNIVVGLLPLFRVIRKTPAKILSRHDVEWFEKNKKQTNLFYLDSFVFSFSFLFLFLVCLVFVENVRF